MAEWAEAALAPCQPVERVAPLRGMLARRPMSLWPEGMRDQAEAEAVLQGWADDLAEYPADIIRAAFRAWQETNTAFLPYQIGQLRPFLQAALSRRRFVALAARRALQRMEDGGNAALPAPQPRDKVDLTNVIEMAVRKPPPAEGRPMSELADWRADQLRRLGLEQ